MYNFYFLCLMYSICIIQNQYHAVLFWKKLILHCFLQRKETLPTTQTPVLKCRSKHTHWVHSSVQWSRFCTNTVRWCGRSLPRSDSDTLQHTESRRNLSDNLERNTQEHLYSVYILFSVSKRGRVALFISPDSVSERWSTGLEMSLEAAFLGLANLFRHIGNNMDHLWRLNQT